MDPDVVAGDEGLIRTAETPVAPFVAVEIRVASLGPATVVAGIVADDGDHVVATYSGQRHLVTIELRLGGRTVVLRQVDETLTEPFGFAFVLCENQVTALADQGDGWRPLITCRQPLARHLDLRRTEVLSRFAYAYGLRPADEGMGATTPSLGPDAATPPLRSRFRWRRRRRANHPAGPGGGKAQVSQVTAGPFGMAGVRDPHVVQLPDGTPYTRDGLLYLTLTCAGLGFFQQAHWGVFTFDPADPTRLEQVAQLYFTRDGLVYGDHAGQIVADVERGEFVVVVSSWGDFSFNGVGVRHVVTSDDILSGVHVLPSAPLPMPTDVSSWDPALTRIDDRWYVGFVESPTQGDPFDFHPALAVGQPGEDYDARLQLVGADSSLHQCEGPVLAKIEGTWYLLASDGDGRRYPVYDLDMRYVGDLDAPYPTNIPHPQVITLDDDGSGRHLLVTFEGTAFGEPVLAYGSHGDFVVMQATAADVVRPQAEVTTSKTATLSMFQARPSTQG